MTSTFVNVSLNFVLVIFLKEKINNFNTRIYGKYKSQ